MVAGHLLHATANLSQSRGFGAACLISHGMVKIVLVFALLRPKRWAYPATLAFLEAFVTSQLYRLTFAPNVGFVALTVFDLVVGWLVWREYLRVEGKTWTPVTKRIKSVFRLLKALATDPRIPRPVR